MLSWGQWPLCDVWVHNKFAWIRSSSQKDQSEFLDDVRLRSQYRGYVLREP